MKKVFPGEIIKLEEALLNFIGEKDPKIFKTDLPDNKWKYLTKKIAYPYEFCNILDDYRKPIEDLKKKTSWVN